MVQFIQFAITRAAMAVFRGKPLPSPTYPQLSLSIPLILGHEHLLLPNSKWLKKMSRE